MVLGQRWPQQRSGSERVLNMGVDCRRDSGCGSDLHVVRTRDARSYDLT